MEGNEDEFDSDYGVEVDVTGVTGATGDYNGNNDSNDEGNCKF